MYRAAVQKGFFASGGMNKKNVEYSIVSIVEMDKRRMVTFLPVAKVFLLLGWLLD